MQSSTLTVSIIVVVVAIVIASVSKQLSVFLAIILGGMVLAAYTSIQSKKRGPYDYTGTGSIK